MEEYRTQLPLDYSRCANKTCPMNEECARFKDIPFLAPWLAYTTFEPSSNTECELFIKYSLDLSEK